MMLKVVLPLLTALFISGCASMSSVKPKSPSVSVASVRPSKLSLTKQTLEFTLRIENPNSFDLPLESISFDANFAGDPIAKGYSDTRVTIPANGDALLDVSVETGILKLMSRFKSMMDKKEINLNYGVTGKVKLANWPTNIPFNVKGELEDPLSSESKLDASQ